LSEGPKAGDLASDDERLHRVGPFVRADRFHIGHVAHDVHFEQKVAARSTLADELSHCKRPRLLARQAFE
jgi:hypothetical protein